MYLKKYESQAIIYGANGVIGDNKISQYSNDPWSGLSTVELSVCADIVLRNRVVCALGKRL